MALLFMAMGPQDIAKELGLSKRLVKHHLHDLYVKHEIYTGVKRVKLLSLLYRMKVCRRPLEYPVQRNCLLTPRELLIVSLVSSGLRDQDISLRIKMTINTYKKQLTQIYDKLGVWNIIS